VNGAIRQAGADVTLTLRVQPRASRTEIAAFTPEAIRIRLMAPPVDGAANEALIDFLAESLEVPRRSITLRSGHTGRNKVVTIRGISADRVATSLGLAGPRIRHPR
jgi:uncharacterized protein (TIGR00251 family)